MGGGVVRTDGGLMHGSNTKRDLLLVLFGAALTGRTWAKRIGAGGFEGTDLRQAFIELESGQAGEIVKRWMNEHGVTKENGTPWLEAVAAKMQREYRDGRIVELCSRLSFALQTKQDAESARLAAELLRESVERGLIE